MKASIILTISKEITTMVDFICGDGLLEAINIVVGDIHLDAAKLALELSQVSTSPEARINSAITHLEAAHIAYSNIHSKTPNFLNKNTDWMEVWNACQKDIWVCCLMALCYMSLRDYRATKKVLSLAEVAFSHRKAYDTPCGAEVFLALPVMFFIGWCNSRNWQDSLELMSAEEFDKFKKNLNVLAD